MTRVQLTSFTFLCIILSCAGASSQERVGACVGGTVTVQRGDTLSQLAARCNVSEGSILSANPDIDGSMDLAAGQTLNLSRSRTSSQDIGSKLGNFADQAHDTIGRVADQVGASVDDLLDKNPDLRSRLDALGRRIGLSDGATKPTVAVTPKSAAPGSPVTVSGVGWPKDSSVTIGAGAPGSAYEVFQTTRSSSNGTFDVHVQVPSWAAANDQLVFIAKVGREARAQSEHLRVR